MTDSEPAMFSAMCRRLRQVAFVLLALACLPVFAATPKCSASSWPVWESWASRYVQEDGRVLNSSMEINHSTSEGQGYSMMFALVANDQTRFEHLWKWTVANMMGSDPKTRLPGWLWGQGKDGQWQLQDANSASDAELWMVYALLEAAQLWQRPDYRKDALSLLATIEATLVVDLPGFGKMLLPGPQGFMEPNKLWILNPSYLPLPVLRRLEKERPTGPGREIADNTVKLIQRSSPKGYVADWVGYRMTTPERGEFVLDTYKGNLGSYDAIRVYIWAGMTPRKASGYGTLLGALDGMRQATAAIGVPPEKVQVDSGALDGQAPFGFYAALVPYLMAKGEPLLAAQFQRSAQTNIDAALAQEAPRPELLYYNMMLSMFALGWVEKRYQFRDDGTLKLSWEKSCALAALR
jgi:endo-1,4-beta-D-glucanase Y